MSAYLSLYLDVCSDICHQVLDLYSKTPHPQKDIEPPISMPRSVAAVAVSDDSQSRLTPRTPQTPKSVSSFFLLNSQN